MTDKSRWSYYLRDDGLAFREFKGTVQYYFLDQWVDSVRCTTAELQGPRFEKVNKADLDLET